jgi:hypothetical protein
MRTVITPSILSILLFQCATVSSFSLTSTSARSSTRNIDSSTTSLHSTGQKKAFYSATYLKPSAVSPITDSSFKSSSSSLSCDDDSGDDGGDDSNDYEAPDTESSSESTTTTAESVESVESVEVVEAVESVESVEAVKEEAVLVVEEELKPEVVLSVTEDSSSTTPTPTATPPQQSSEAIKDSLLPAQERLADAIVTSVRTNEQVNLSTFLTTSGSSSTKNMVILGTYAADFNAIEYVQRLRYYLPKLQEKGVGKIALVLNCEPEAAKTLVNLLDLDTDANAENNDAIVELFVDPLGDAGRKFYVGRGWRPEDEEMSPYVKLFGMLWGLGAWATLPAVIGGYIGNPFFAQPWIEDALAVGQRKGRWPDTALELDDETSQIKVNKFKELPYVGEWERRPLELATLRLQNMLDISIKNWKELAPTEEALGAGVLTQLGGCAVVDSATGKQLYQWKDPGICAVANFENILKDLDS